MIRFQNGCRRVWLGEARLFISVVGQTSNQGVREALDELAVLAEALKKGGVPHEVYLRKVRVPGTSEPTGEYEPDTLIFDVSNPSDIELRPAIIRLLSKLV